jgi:hypothetical protein
LRNDLQRHFGKGDHATPQSSATVNSQTSADEWDIGRSLGSAAFVARIEAPLGRTLAPDKRGRKPATREPLGERWVRGLRTNNLRKDGCVTVIAQK